MDEQPASFEKSAGCFFLNRFARHNKQRRHFKTFELGAQPFAVIEAIHIDRLLGAGDNVNRDVVVPAVLEHDYHP